MPHHIRLLQAKGCPGRRVLSKGERPKDVKKACDKKCMGQKLSHFISSKTATSARQLSTFAFLPGRTSSVVSELFSRRLFRVFRASPAGGAKGLGAPMALSSHLLRRSLGPWQSPVPQPNLRHAEASLSRDDLSPLLLPKPPCGACSRRWCGASFGSRSGTSEKEKTRKRERGTRGETGEALPSSPACVTSAACIASGGDLPSGELSLASLKPPLRLQAAGSPACTAPPGLHLLCKSHTGTPRTKTARSPPSSTTLR